MDLDLGWILQPLKARLMLTAPPSVPFLLKKWGAPLSGNVLLLRDNEP